MKWINIIVIAVVFINFSFSNDKIGPYEISFKGLDYCKNQSEMKVKYDYKIQKINRTTFVINAHGYIDQPISDELKFKIRVDQWSNGGWKENYFTGDSQSFGNIGLCTMVAKFAPAEARKRVFEAAGAKERNCIVTPFPPGNCTLTNLVLSVDLSHVFPVYYYNKYKIHASLYYHSKMIGCAIVSFDVIPKKVRKG